MLEKARMEDCCGGETGERRRFCMAVCRQHDRCDCRRVFIGALKLGRNRGGGIVVVVNVL